MLPVVFPKVEIVKRVPRGHRWTVRTLCRTAGIACRVTGPSAERRVYTSKIQPGAQEGRAFREPGSLGPVSIELKPGKEADLALLALGILAYSAFDYAARESLRGLPEARPALPLGRPRKARPLSGAERQRRWRLKAQTAK